ncbi:MarR family transcriptional regulator [Actinoplanes sp. NBRC 101535]|uniref:MarR family winged helix-turn-helix transcriptional regulator n=1 Tax=Actinoplanes sp. NBRC 101535 TaxID=3032196 RepID=UPI003335AFE8
METPEPQWLTPGERASWLALTSLFMRLPVALDAQLQRDAELSHFEYGILAGLSEAPERTLRMSVLAMLAEGSLARLSQAVARMEKRGWVRRRPDPTDGRYTLATLTDEGWDKIAATAPGHVDEVRRLVFDPLTKAQVRQLHEIARRIMRAVDPDDTCGATRVPSAGSPADSSARPAAGSAAEASIDATAGSPVGTPGGTPGGTPVGSPGGTPGGTPVGTPGGSTAESR